MSAARYSRYSPGKYSLWIDWETSGSDFDGKSHERFQGISFGAIIADNETFEEVDSLYCELKFDDSKYEWTKEAENIHGLTREYLAANGMEREDALAALLELILKWIGGNAKICMGGHNVDFDIDFTNQLLNDFGISLNFHHVKLETSGAAFICTGLYRSDDVFKLFASSNRDRHNSLEDARLALSCARGMRAIVKEVLEF